MEHVVTWCGLHYWEVLFAVMVAGFLVVLYRLHESDDNEFSFEQFFTDDDGKANLKRLFGFGAFGVHSWITARYAAVTQLNEQMLGLVGAYALLWAGVLMLGKGVEGLLDAFAGAIARKFGIDLGERNGCRDTKTGG